MKISPKKMPTTINIKPHKVLMLKLAQLQELEAQIRDAYPFDPSMITAEEAVFHSMDDLKLTIHNHVTINNQIRWKPERFN